MPTMNAKYLGAFMLLATQDGWASDVFGQQQPDFTQLQHYGLTDLNFLNEFWANLNKNDNLDSIRTQIAAAALADPQKTPGMKDIHRKIFEILTSSMAANVPGYTQPPCPTDAALKAIINAINNA